MDSRSSIANHLCNTLKTDPFHTDSLLDLAKLLLTGSGARIKPNTLALDNFPSLGILQGAYLLRHALVHGKHRTAKHTAIIYTELAQLIVLNLIPASSVEFIDGVIPNDPYQQAAALCKQALAQQQQLSEAMLILAHIIKEKNLRIESSCLCPGFDDEPTEKKLLSLYSFCIAYDNNPIACMDLANFILEKNLHVHIHEIGETNIQTPHRNAKRLCQHVLKTEPQNQEALALLKTLRKHDKEKLATTPSKPPTKKRQTLSILTELSLFSIPEVDSANELQTPVSETESKQPYPTR